MKESQPQNKVKRRPFWLLSTAAFFSSNSPVFFGNAFSPAPHPCRCHHPRTESLNGIPESPQSEKAKSSYSNFWYSTQTNQGADDKREDLPCVPTLDKDGPLPSGAYILHGNPKYESKQTCRISIAMDMPETLQDPSLSVRNLQRCIDSGLTSFQIKHDHRQIWTEENIYGKLFRETPAFVTNDCRVSVPLHVPDRNFASSAVRNTVLSSLDRLGIDALDDIQLHYNKFSPYYLEVMDVLVEMQRDGWIRGISGMALPPNLVRKLHDSGFALDSVQHDTNLLQTKAVYRDLDQQWLLHDLGLPLTASGPLLGGLLTSRFLSAAQYRQRPLPIPQSQMSMAQRRHWRGVVLPWAQSRLSSSQPSNSNSKDAWHAYQNVLLSKLDHLALKYRVSIASIVLRWLLQNDDCDSVIISSRCGNTDQHLDDDVPFLRPSQWRQVFTFALDDEDMESLWELAGGKPEPYLFSKDDRDDYDNDEKGASWKFAQQRPSGLYLP